MTAPPLQRHSATDIVFSNLNRIPLQQAPLQLKRSSTIDGSEIIRMMNNRGINRPATRRMRTLAIKEEEEGGCLEAGNLVYVGANPVIKKTTRMLRKSSSVNLKKKQTHSSSSSSTKSIPKRASQTSLKKASRGRSRRGSLTTNSSLEVAMESNNVSMPRRKASNPFLRGGLVGQEPKSQSLSPVPNSSLATRSSSTAVRRRSPRRNLKFSLSMDAPRAPCRKASIQDMISNSRMARPTNIKINHINAPCMPHRKASNPFLRQGLVPTTTSTIMLNEPIMTRSRSRQKIQASLPCTRPSRKASLLQIAAAADTPLAVPHRKASNISLSTNKQSFLDLEWDKLSLKDAANANYYYQQAPQRRVPRAERHRKPTGTMAA